jgi:hypothetical protein
LQYGKVFSSGHTDCEVAPGRPRRDTLANPPTGEQGAATD